MDINTTLQEFINKHDDNNQATDLDNVVRNIFITCDTENIGSVQVSKIIDFVEPFLQQNVEAVEHLKACLTTSTENPDIDMETFCNNMRVWAEKVTNANNKRDLELDASSNMNSEKNTGYFQYDRHPQRNYWDTTVLNLSEYSNESHEICISERSALENQIQELQHQRNQMKEDLARTRLELHSCHEQNESLQGNLDKLYKKLTNEQKLNANLQLDRKKDEELHEELSLADKQIVKLEKAISTLEKQNNQLQQNLEHSQSQKQHLEQKIQNMEKKFEENIADTRILHTEIDLKQQKLVSEHETNISLIKRNQELQDVIEECNINLEKLKLEKESLEKVLREQLEKTGSLISLNKTYQSINTSLQTNIDAAVDDDISAVKTDDSIDEEFYYNFHMMFLNTSAVSSNLRDEMKKVVTDSINDEKENNEWDCSLDRSELEKELVKLKCELAEHMNCSIIIDKQNEEIKYMSRENCSFKEQLESLTASCTNLKTELLLCQDKELLLLNRCSSLEDNLKSNSDFVDDMQLKLSEYTDLENKCKELAQKIQELETENSMKYVKIVNLTVEIEKLRQILARTEQQNQDELKKKINQLDEERKLHEEEKNKLLEKIEALNKEKCILLTEKEELLSKIIELENQRRRLQTDKDELRSEHETLQAENMKIKLKKDIIKSELTKLQSEKDSLQFERDFLKGEYIDLELAKDELEDRLRSQIVSLEVGMAEYKDEHSFNLNLKIQVEELSGILEKLEEDYKSITNEYTESKAKAEEDKKIITQLTDDNVKMNKEITSLKDKNSALSLKNNALEKELLKYREKNDCYLEINQELDKFKNKLISENKELISKIDKNETCMKRMDIDNKQLGIDLVNLKLTFDKMKTTMKLYEDLNENLNTENYSLKSMVKEQKQSIREKETDLNKLCNLCRTYENDISVLEMNVQESQTDNRNLKNQLKDKEEILLQLEEEQKKNIQNNHLEKENMKEHIHELQRKLDETNAIWKEQKQIEIRLQSNTEEISKTLTLEKEKQEYLKQNIADLEKKISEEKHLGQTLMEDYERAVSEIDDLKKTIFKLESRIGFVEKQNEILDKEKNSLKNISEENSKKLATFVRCKNELMEKNKKLSIENIELRRNYDNLTEETLKKTQSLDAANNKVDELLKDLHNVEKKVRDNERHRLGFLKNEVVRNKEESEKTRKENDRLRRELEIMAEKVKLLETDNAETKQSIEELMIEKDLWLTEKLNTCKSIDNVTRSKATTSFDRLVKKNMKLDDKILSLKEELCTAREKHAEKSREVEIMKDQEARLLNEIQSIKDELHKAIDNNDDLIKEVEELLNKITNLRKENESLKYKNDQLNTLNQTLISKKEQDQLQFEDSGRKASEVNDFQNLCSLREQLQTQINKQKSIENYINAVRDRLCERRLRLGRATLHVMRAWKADLETETDCIATASKPDLQPEHLIHPIAGALDEEILQIEYQIQVTTSLLDRLTSYKNHELLRKTIPSSDYQDSVEQETSPSINTDVLENLGLSGNLVRIDNFSTVEMEEKFTALVLAYTIDNTSLHQRYTRQKNRLREKELSLGEEISMLSIQLEKHAHDLDVSPRLERILSLCTQVSISAEQFGSLTQQVNLNKAVDLMVNYVARLRQSLDAQQNQYLCIKPLPVKLPIKNEVSLGRRKTWDDIIVINDMPLPAQTTKKFWTKETYFMVSLSIAVLLIAMFFNTYKGCSTTFEFSPVTPPT